MPWPVNGSKKSAASPTSSAPSAVVRRDQRANGPVTSTRRTSRRAANRPASPGKRSSSAKKSRRGFGPDAEAPRDDGIEAVCADHDAGLYRLPSPVSRSRDNPADRPRVVNQLFDGAVFAGLDARAHGRVAQNRVE